MEGYVKVISRSYLWGVDLLMILVTLGTQDKGFDRLLKAIDREIKKGTITDRVVVQAGYTEYQSDKMEIFDMIDKEALEKLTQEADLIITHGGVGSILTALSYGKTIIAVPRLKKYKEHTNDHQKQIVNRFAKEGYILAAKDLSQLGKMIEKAKTFHPKKYRSNRDQFLQVIDQYIIDTNHTSWLNRDGKIIGVVMINFLVFWLLTTWLENAYIASSIAYLLSIGLTLLMHHSWLKAPFRLAFYFYALDILILLLIDQLDWPILVGKLLANLIAFIIYHFLEKANNK